MVKPTKTSEKISFYRAKKIQGNYINHCIAFEIEKKQQQNTALNTRV